MKANLSINYSVELTKTLKKSDKIMCQVCGEDIYISNGHFIYVLDAYEYERLVQPVTKVLADNYEIEKGNYRKLNFDMKSYFDNYSGVDSLSLFPFTYHAGYYSRTRNMSLLCPTSGDYVVCLNEDYVSALKVERMKVCGESNKAPVTFSNAFNKMIAVILPINFCDSQAITAVKSYYGIAA